MQLPFQSPMDTELKQYTSVSLRFSIEWHPDNLPGVYPTFETMLANAKVLVIALAGISALAAVGVAVVHVIEGGALTAGVMAILGFLGRLLGTVYDKLYQWVGPLLQGSLVPAQ